MKAYKRFLAGLCAVATVFSITACSKDDEQSSSEYKQQVKVEVTASAEDIASLPGGEESTILYMGENDLNPTSDGQEKSVELKLFEEKGGKIEFSRVANKERFDKLAAAIIAQTDVPDTIRISIEWLAFPSQIVSGKISAYKRPCGF